LGNKLHENQTIDEGNFNGKYKKKKNGRNVGFRSQIPGLNMLKS